MATRPTRRTFLRAPAPTQAPAADGRIRPMIEAIQPQIDDGHFPVKRVPGDEVVVSADVFADGHDVLGAAVLYRHLPHGRAAGVRWQEVSMQPIDNDRWTATFRVDELGRYEYAVEAWIDPFASWRLALIRRAAAQAVTRADLVEGVMLLHAAAARAASTLPRDDFGARWLLTGAKEIIARLAADDVAAATARVLDDDQLRQTASRHVDRSRAARSPAHPVLVDRERARLGAWYEMFPRSTSPVAGKSGTFRDAAARLADIADMGFDVLYLPPIHPIGRTGRKGRGNTRPAAPGDPGSPWAIGSIEGGHKDVDPHLGTLDDFDEFVRQAREAGLDVAMDLAYQCSPDHPYVREHPEWFGHRPDGSIRFAENPPKRYEDIYPFDFECADWQALWQELASIVLFWAERGVRIFRVDNPHTKPFPFWAWLIARARDRHPDIVFLAEAFTRPKVMRRLAKLGFDQSYTYFTWRNTKAELTEYFTELTQSGLQEYFRPNLFANTPDILHAYLQQGGPAAFRVRFILAATLGATYGIYSGFELCEGAGVAGTEEYLDSEKYEIRRRDWDRPGHIKTLIRTVNRLRREEPALRRDETLTFHETDNPQLLAYSKAGDGRGVFVVVNLDPHHVQHGHVRTPLDRLGLTRRGPFAVEDLLDGARYTWQGESAYVRLDPANRVAHILRPVTVQRVPAPMRSVRVEMPGADTIVDVARPALPAGAAADLFAAPIRDAMERDVLIPYLKRQRWIAGKARDLQQVRFVNWTRLATAAAPLLSALVEARYAHDAAERYHLVFTRADAATTARLLREHPDAVIALLDDAAGGALVDGVMDDDACRALVSVMGRGMTTAADQGVVVAHPVASAAPAADLAMGLEVRRLAAAHSNSAVTLGGHYLLKLFRRVQPGLNPDVEIGRFLTARHDLQIPQLVGSLEYEALGREPITAALVQTLVPSRTSGWDLTVRRGEQALSEIGRTPTSTPGDIIARFADLCGTLGRRTAELHLALAGDPVSPAFSPEPSPAEDADALARRMALHAEEILERLSRQREALDDAARPLARKVLAARPSVAARFAALGAAIGAFTRIRIHGDYHLAQVLVLDHDFVILDFEGEPLRSLAERRAKHSPLRDVASMRRSFSYAAQAALAGVVDGAGSPATLEWWAQVFATRTSAAFVRGYLETPDVTSLLPQDPARIQAALDLFTLDKAFYELNYEMNNRPTWTHVPLTGLAEMLHDGK